MRNGVMVAVSVSVIGRPRGGLYQLFEEAPIARERRLPGSTTMTTCVAILEEVIGLAAAARLPRIMSLDHCQFKTKYFRSRSKTRIEQV
jgi:hypothetical protein